jgi:hypothetical protein
MVVSSASINRTSDTINAIIFLAENVNKGMGFPSSRCQDFVE